MLAATDGLAVVNVVTLESYLLGVVASEMPSDWKPEALEAQAIAARTYAVATRKPATSPYDLYPDERSQVYRGLAGEGAPSSAAVEATAGQVVLYSGPADRHLLLVVLGRAHRGGPGVAPGRRSRAVPRLGRRSVRHHLALPRLDALAE